MTATHRATLIGIVAVLFWALLALFTATAGTIPPFQLMASTFAVAFVGGLIVLLLRGRAGLSELRQPPAPWMTAFLGLFGYHALYFYALQNAPVGEASIICYLWPLFIVLFSAMLPGERLKARHIAGALLGFAGTALIVLTKGGSLEGGGSVLGYLAALGCAFVWSGYSVLNRRYRGTPSGMLVSVCGAVALAALACHQAFEDTVLPSPLQWGAVLALGLGPVGLAFLAWDHATKHGNIALLGTLSYMAPLLSTALLVLTGAAPASPTLAIAALLVIGGAVLATGLPRRKTSTASS